MPKITINKIKEIANDIMREQYEIISEDSIRYDMMTLIGEQKRKLILDALGLENRWNGEVSLKYEGTFRKNLKILSEEYLMPIAKKILHTIFDSEEIVLNEKEKAHLRKVYKESYMEVAEEEIRKLAENAALKDAENLFRDYIDSLE